MENVGMGTGTYLRASHSMFWHPSVYSTKRRKHFVQGIWWPLLCEMATTNEINQTDVFELVEKLTSKPHSGTRSRLLNTMIRSHILPPLPLPINLIEPDGVRPRKWPLDDCHFLMATAPRKSFELDWVTLKDWLKNGKMFWCKFAPNTPFLS
jgi:hypothetical protein